jgi:hypothetical protein
LRIGAIGSQNAGEERCGRPSPLRSTD